MPSVDLIKSDRMFYRIVNIQKAKKIGVNSKSNNLFIKFFWNLIYTQRLGTLFLYWKLYICHLKARGGTFSASICSIADFFGRPLFFGIGAASWTTRTRTASWILLGHSSTPISASISTAFLDNVLLGCCKPHLHDYKV